MQLSRNKLGISAEKNLNKLKLFPRVKEVLISAKEKGFKNILATNAVRKVILLRVEHAGMLHFFDDIITSDDVKAVKSEGKHLEKGLRDLSGSPKDSFSVGDNPIQDIASAKKLGLKTVLCNYGHTPYYHTDHLYTEHKVLAEADYIVNNLNDIISVIK